MTKGFNPGETRRAAWRSSFERWRDEREEGPFLGDVGWEAEMAESAISLLYEAADIIQEDVRRKGGSDG